MVGQCSHVRAVGRLHALPSQKALQRRLISGGLGGWGCHVVICRCPLPGHRLQHGCARGAQGAVCLLRAALDYPAQDHLAGGRYFPVPVPPAAAPEPNRRRCMCALPAGLAGWAFPIPWVEPWPYTWFCEDEYASELHSLWSTVGFTS